MTRYRLILPTLALVLVILLGLTLQVNVSYAQSFGANWTGQYYNNTSFSGAPAITRIDSTINFNFGTGSPLDGFVNADNFSVRWTGTQTIVAGTYTFSATANDGVRVTVDGVIVINQLGAAGLNTFTAQAVLNGDTHTVVVEFVENTGDASIQFTWTLTSGGATAGPSPTVGPTFTPTVTGLPAIPPGSITATVIRAAVLNVRDAPSLGGNVVGKILRGQTYRIIGRDPNARWFLLQLSGKVGWAWGYYLFVDGNEFTPPISSAASAQGLPGGVVDTGVIGQTRAAMKLRAAPTTLSDQTGRIVWGSFLPIVGRTADGGWYQVVWKNTVGWVWSNFVHIRFGDLNNVPIHG